MDEADKELRQRRRRLIRNYDEESRNEVHSGVGRNFREEGVTCCIHGRTTRQIPCQNSNYPGCPFYRRGNERTYGR